jgi:uncharacterized protein (TIGR02271 family)
MAHSEQAGSLEDQTIVPVVEEAAVVRKERVATETVRLRKRVHEDEETFDVPVQTEAIEVERVPVGRWLDAPADVRHEGDTTVYPVVEEVLVVEKRLRLVEEVRVTRRQETRRIQERVGLRREEIVVERNAASRDPEPCSGADRPGRDNDNIDK